MTRPVQEEILAKRIDLYVIDAARIARAAGLGGRTNTVLQTCFFAISGVLEKTQAIEHVKAAIKKTYGRRGAEVVARNEAAVDRALEGLHRVELPSRVTTTRHSAPIVPQNAPEFVRQVTAAMMAGRGDELPVSSLPVDGTYPSGTTRYEKRNISDLVALWDPAICIQCGNCSFVCPHSVIRSRYYPPSALEGAPSTFRSAPLNAPGLPEARYTLQVYMEDCTGCQLCVEACPVGTGGNPFHKAINLADREPLVASERDNIAFFEQLPRPDRSRRGLRDSARHAVPGTAVRVLWSVRRLRRDPVPQASVAAFRRPPDGRQCHRLLVDIWREPPDHPLDRRRGRARAGVVELAVRGQRRVRTWAAAQR